MTHRGPIGWGCSNRACPSRRCGSSGCRTTAASRDTSSQLRMLRRRRGARSPGWASSGSLVGSPLSPILGWLVLPPACAGAPNGHTGPVRGWRQYLRENADPRDVIATNRVINGTTRDEGEHNRDLSVSALGRPAHRRLRLRVVPAGYRAGLDHPPLFPEPFCDPIHLAAEQALVTAPRRAGLKAYVTRGTRWILADERSRPVSPALRRLGSPRCSSTTASTSTGSTLPAADPVRAGPGQGPAGAGAALGADTVSSRSAGDSSAAVSSPPPSSCVGSSLVCWTTSTSDRRSSRRSGAEVASSASAAPRCESRAARRLSRRSLARSNSKRRGRRGRGGVGTELGGPSEDVDDLLRQEEVRSRAPRSRLPRHSPSGLRTGASPARSLGLAHPSEHGVVDSSAIGSP